MAQIDDFDALAELLPFYANGTLAADDRHRIDAALVRSAALRAELQNVQSIALMVHEGGHAMIGSVTAPHADRLNKLLERIDIEPTAEPKILPFPKRAFAPDAPQRKWSNNILSKFAIAATALIVAQTGLIAYFAMSPKPHDYGTLSGPSAATNSDSIILIRLEPSAQWHDVENLLATQNLVICDMNAGSVIGLCAKLSQESVPAVADRIAALRASPLIQFAGPAA